MLKLQIVHPKSKMQHKFASLIELTTIWESLSNDELVTVIKHILENDVVGSFKKAIISGIFQQIYDDGDLNDDMFFADLLVLSQDLKKSEIQSHESRIEQLADTLLCHIASYLPAKNVFSKWNLVNRKFIQIGLKPASIKRFESNSFENVAQYPPKFNLDVTLSKLDSSCGDGLLISRLINQRPSKYPQSFCFCMC